MVSPTASDGSDTESRWHNDDSNGEAELPQQSPVRTGIVADRERGDLDQHASEHAIRNRQSFSTFHTNISVMTDLSIQEMTGYAIDPDREVQRTKVLSHVATADAWRHNIGDFCSLSAAEQKDRLYSFAKKICKREEFIFCRFRQLSIFNILEAQHRLILMEEQLQYVYKASPTGDEEGLKDRSLGEAFNAYIDAIKAFQTLELIKSPDRKHIKPMSANLAHKLHEPHYWDGPDALKLLDLKVFAKTTATVPAKAKASKPAEAEATGPADAEAAVLITAEVTGPAVAEAAVLITAEATGPTDADARVLIQAETTDSLRLFLQAHAPAAFLDPKGIEQRKLLAEDPESGGAGTLFMRQDALTRMGPWHISPIVDFSARMLMCLFGGVSLVAPIIVLVFVKDSLTLTLVLTVVFVLVVVMVLPLVCRASTPNEALLAATAAYVAVLAVFVANVSVAVRG